MARVIKHEARKQEAELVPGSGLMRPLIGKFLLNGIKERRLQDRRLFACVQLSLISDLSNVEAIAKQIRKASLLE